MRNKNIFYYFCEKLFLYYYVTIAQYEKIYDTVTKNYKAFRKNRNANN